MYFNFDNARTRLCVEYRSISGLDIAPEWVPWFELYRDAFIEKLDKLGFTKEDDFVTLLKIVDQYPSVGFVFDKEETQQAELAAYGLIVFDRILRAEEAGVSHVVVFAMHQELMECYGPELLTFFRGEQARRNKHKSNEKYISPRAWVLSEWEKRSDQDQSKAAFARQYSALVKKKFDVFVIPETISRTWLPKVTNKGFKLDVC